MTVRIAQWTLDVQDVDRMIEFWSAALRMRVDRGDDGAAKLFPPDAAPTDVPTLWLQPTAPEKTVKNRVHPDLRPVDGDVDAEVDRLLRLGARHAEVGQTGEESFVVLADPEGNEFCVLRREPRGTAGVPMNEVIWSALPRLRVHPVPQRLRGYVGGELIVDSGRVRLVWEPRRITAVYAVPAEDLNAELVDHVGEAEAERPVRVDRDSAPVLDPSSPFSAHSCPGSPLTLRTADRELVGAGFAPDDPSLAGYVVLDWRAFEEWREEDEVMPGHPKDPFHRIDCLRSSRQVVVSADGHVLAETTRSVMLFENPLTVRYYIPREDVRMELLEPSDRRSVCPYKGTASYWSAQVGDLPLKDIAWSYQEPLNDAAPVGGLVAFFTERLDVTVDGVQVERPVTPWS